MSVLDKNQCQYTWSRIKTSLPAWYESWTLTYLLQVCFLPPLVHLLWHLTLSAASTKYQFPICDENRVCREKNKGLSHENVCTLKSKMSYAIQYMYIAKHYWESFEVPVNQVYSGVFLSYSIIDWKMHPLFLVGLQGILWRKYNVRLQENTLYV